MDVRIRVCLDMHMDMCIGMDMDRCMEMGGTRVWTCVWMWLGYGRMCLDMCKDVCFRGLPPSAGDCRPIGVTAPSLGSDMSISSPVPQAPIASVRGSSELR